MVYGVLKKPSEDDRSLGIKLAHWEKLQMRLIELRKIYSKQVVHSNEVQARVYEPIKQSIHAQRKL